MTRLLLATVFLAVASPAIGQPDDWTHRDRRDGLHLRILRDYHLVEGAVSREPIVVVGGSATIDGRAEHDVAVIGGTLRIGPKATVRGDVVSVGGRTIIDPSARIEGSIEEAEVLLPSFSIALGPLVEAWWPLARFGATLLRLAIVFVVTLLLIVVAPGVVAAISSRVFSSPATSAMVGVTGQVLFVPATVAIAVSLAISIVGIPLLLAFPFLFGAMAILWVAGFAGVAITLGARLRGTHAGDSNARVFDLLTGFVLISAVTLIAQALAMGSGSLGPAAWALRVAGWLIEWMAWTVGLGAALAWLLGRRQAVLPPPVPWPSPAGGLS